MTVPEIRNIVDAWTQQYEEIGKLPYVKHVQILENKVGGMVVVTPLVSTCVP